MLLENQTYRISPLFAVALAVVYHQHEDEMLPAVPVVYRVRVNKKDTKALMNRGQPWFENFRKLDDDKFQGKRRLW